MKLPPKRPLKFNPQYVSVALSAAVMQLAYQPFGLGVIAWFGLVPFMLAISASRNGREAAKLGLVWGLWFFGLHISWLITFVGRYADHMWMGLIPWGFCIFIEALFIGLFAAVVKLASSQKWYSAILAGALWASFELLRSAGSMGFLWGQLAVTQSRSLVPLQSVSLLGSWGLSALIIAVNCTIAKMYATKSYKSATPVFVILVAAMVYGVYTLHHQYTDGPTIRVTVIQPNIEVTHTPEFQTIPKILDKAREGVQIARNMDSDLLVYPESYLPDMFPGMLDEGFTDISTHGLTIVAGGGWMNGEKSYNAVSAYDKGVMTHYAKQHLVPWGEYIPFRKQMPWVSNFGANFGDRTAGTSSDVLTQYRIGAPICFESIIPWVSLQMVQKQAKLLCVVTNDAWFGGSPAARQHFEFSILRAAEHHRWLVRSSLTGISGLINPTGRIIRVTPKYQGCSFNDRVTLLSTRTLYSRLGDFGSLAVLFAIGFLTSWPSWRHKASEKHPHSER